MVINTTIGAQSIQDSFSIRRTALLRRIPYFTTVSGAMAAAHAIAAGRADPGAKKALSLQDYHERKGYSPAEAPEDRTGYRADRT